MQLNFCREKAGSKCISHKRRIEIDLLSSREVKKTLRPCYTENEVLLMFHLMNAFNELGDLQQS